jgi:hypothetical protein
MSHVLLKELHEERTKIVQRLDEINKLEEQIFNDLDDGILLKWGIAIGDTLISRGNPSILFCDGSIKIDTTTFNDYIASKEHITYFSGHKRIKITKNEDKFSLHCWANDAYLWGGEYSRK